MVQSSASASASATTSTPQSMKSTLLTSLAQYTCLTSSLFSTIEQLSSTSTIPTDSSTSSTNANNSISTLLSQLHSLDEILAEQLNIAREHSSNQRRIQELVNRAKERDKANLKAIRKLDQLNNHVKAILTNAQKELDSIDRAEQGEFNR